VVGDGGERKGDVPMLYALDQCQMISLGLTFSNPGPSTPIESQRIYELRVLPHDLTQTG
jgi:hypothetical protein